jgi:hypothetical protein
MACIGTRAHSAIDMGTEGAQLTPITVTVRPDEATRTPNSGCVWVAEATIEGRAYVARSRHGAPNALPRQLVAAGLADRPMVIRYQGFAGAMTWRSFHAAANWTYSEGDQPVRRVRYKERPEGLSSVRRTGQKCVSSPAADVVDLPPTVGDEMAARTTAAGTRECGACGRSFRPSRPWARFCRPACRLRAHRSEGANESPPEALARSEAYERRR